MRGVDPDDEYLNLDLNNLHSFQLFYINLTKDLKYKLEIFKNSSLSADEIDDFRHLSEQFLRGVFLIDYYKFIQKRLTLKQKLNVNNQINTFIIPKIDEFYDIVSYHIQKNKEPLDLETLKDLLWRTLGLFDAKYKRTRWMSAPI
jgi:DNA polymerase elongation subunit (family B)